ncbi:hypothetical protein PR048_009934 [Dryococelus australis]|uniref:Uncharacterized protein n=1 Tax=Dryococelus australis TaxID=614101 RepID=A0ABQ9I1B0_9NEOP|nr:hypothetical protein PR048_009934 [Dryococelus australis]
MMREWSSAGMQGAEETGDLRENPHTSGIVRHDSHLRKSGNDPAGDWFTLGVLRLHSFRTDLATPTEASRIQFPDFRVWEALWMLLLAVGAGLAGFLGDLPLPLPLHSGAAPFSTQPFYNFCSQTVTRRSWVGVRHGIDPHSPPPLLVAERTGQWQAKGLTWRTWHLGPRLVLPSALSLTPPGAVVAKRLACSPPTRSNRAQSPAGSLPDFRMWESCRTMPLVGGPSQESPVSPAPLIPALLHTQLSHPRRLPRPHSSNLFTHSPYPSASNSGAVHDNEGHVCVQRTDVNVASLRGFRDGLSGQCRQRPSPRGNRTLANRPFTPAERDADHEPQYSLKEEESVDYFIIDWQVFLEEVLFSPPLHSTAASTSAHFTEHPFALKPTGVKRGECVATPERMSEKTGDPRENPPISGIVQHDSHIQKSGRDPAGTRTRFA